MPSALCGEASRKPQCISDSCSNTRPKGPVHAHLTVLRAPEVRARGWPRGVLGNVAQEPHWLVDPHYPQASECQTSVEKMVQQPFGHSARLPGRMLADRVWVKL